MSDPHTFTLRDVRNQNIWVFGAARSGISAARWLVHLGGQVTIIDDKNPQVPGFDVLPSTSTKLPPLPRFMILSPGVPRTHPLVVEAQQQRVPIYTEMDLAAAHLNDCQYLGVTGSNGKSTTTTMLGCIMQAYEPRTFVGGNLGKPLCDALIEQTEPKIAVLELSSFHLETLCNIRFDIGIVTNLVPDHLDRYSSVEEYYKTKAHLADMITDKGVFIWNGEDANSTALFAGLQIKNKPFYSGQDKFRLPSSVIGKHNFENAAAAFLAASEFGVPQDVIQAGISAYQGIAHRLERIGSINNVDWYNDSKATNVEATLMALAAFDRPIHLILGGKGKGASYNPLVDASKEHVKSVLVIGEDAPNILAAFGQDARVSHAYTLEAACTKASQDAVAGDIILLSPACASYDQFDNFEQRGDVFKSLFKEVALSLSDLFRQSKP